MTDKNAGLSQAFVTQQQQRLEALRDQLLHVNDDTGAEEQDLRDADADQPHDAADEGATMTQQEINEALHDEYDQQLRVVERALEKIREGTYGLSEVSGEPIPQARLEAIPEALYTIEEESQRESGHTPLVKRHAP
jgi:DnaK suppressor protein